MSLIPTALSFFCLLITQLSCKNLQTELSPRKSLPAVSTTELIFSRINIPLRSGRIQQNILEQNIEDLALKAELATKLGCKSLPQIEHLKLGSINRRPSLGNVTMRGFLNATQKSQSRDALAKNFQFNSIQEGDQIEVLYSLSTDDYSFIAPGPPLLQSAFILQKTKHPLGESQLVKATHTIPIDSKSELIFEWNSEGLTENSQIRIQIGGTRDDKGLVCFARPESGRMALKVGEYDALLPGLHDVQLKLVDYVLIPATQNNGMAWLLNTVDWRSGRVEVL